MLADSILVLHFFIAGFIVLGLILVWIGALAGWRWIRNPWFRYAHPDSFVGRSVYRLPYYNAPEWVFTAAYCVWAAAGVATLKFLPPTQKAG